MVEVYVLDRLTVVRLDHLAWIHLILRTLVVHHCSALIVVHGLALHLKTCSSLVVLDWHELLEFNWLLRCLVEIVVDNPGHFSEIIINIDARMPLFVDFHVYTGILCDNCMVFAYFWPPCFGNDYENDYQKAASTENCSCYNTSNFS